MRLKQLIKILDIKRTAPAINDFEVRGISCDSKKVSHNFIFAAIKGNKADGHQFIQEAIERGAKAVLIQSSVVSPAYRQAGRQSSVNILKVKDTRKALAKLAAEFYGNPSAKIKVVGITGTNGKTTISYLIEALLKESGSIPAVIGTVNYRFKDKIIPSKNTTPGPIEIQSLLADTVKEGVDYAIIEVSSHALDQDRIEGINFHSAIFTNLTQDHLDYHGTLENYFQAKAKLFKNLKASAFAVINSDSKYSQRLKRLTQAKIITYGIENSAQVTAKEIKFDSCSTEFRLTTAKEEMNLKTRLIGKHNVYNILAAATWAIKENITLSTIKSALEKFQIVPGRLQRINTRRDFVVFVDYAHTEDALENVIRSLRQVSRGRIIVLFGCGGERDKTKRPKMGRAVSELADFAVITSDNPRCEEPQEIINEILAGIKKNNYCVVLDRKEAIKKALSMAKSNDIVLLAGKGHEDYQILKDKTVHFNDHEVARECLSLMNC